MSDTPRTDTDMLSELAQLRSDRDFYRSVCLKRGKDLDAMKEEMDSYKVDAERYRWLRNQTGEDGRAMVSVLKPGCEWFDDEVGVSKEPLDVAIDAARREER